MSIIIFTILVKLVLVPLTKNQMSSAKKMQELQPKVKEIQEKYKNNKEKLNEKTMELYKEHKINPVGGCLPLLIQLPIIFGLFRALRAPETYVFPNNPELLEKAMNASFLWLNNLIDPDVIMLGGFKLPWILPIVAAITTYFSMNSASAGQQNQSLKTMNIFLPLMILWWGQSFPAGLTLYWVISNLFQMAQQYFLTKMDKLKEESN